MFLNRVSHKAMEKAMDMLWQKQQVVAHNIANSETPGFKSQEIRFQDVLQRASKQRSSGNDYGFRTSIHSNLSSGRLDGNNVDMEKESLELWQTQAHYAYLTQKVSTEYKNLRYVINQALK